MQLLALLTAVLLCGFYCHPVLAYKGFTDCVRTDDGRPVCISEATGNYHFVTEDFYRTYRNRHLYPLQQDANSSSLPSIADVYAKASESIVFIVTAAEGEPKSIGSGVVIERETVVTNCHVLKGADKAGILYKDAVFTNVSIQKIEVERDVCIVRVAKLPAPVIRIGTSENLRVGQRVLAIGNPQGLELTLSEGLVSSLRRSENERFPMIQTSAAISAGSSGGALLTSDGTLIGITTLQFIEGQNLNFAIPIDWVTELRYSTD